MFHLEPGAKSRRTLLFQLLSRQRMGNQLVLERTMVAKNGESTPRIPYNIEILVDTEVE